MSDETALSTIDRRKQAIASKLSSEKLIADISSALPVGMRGGIDRWRRTAQTAILNNPLLIECSVPSLMSATISAAQMGLFLDPFLGEAAIVPQGKDKETGQTLASLRVMYRGYIKLAYQSDRVALIYAADVCANDDFTMERGAEPKLIHRPARRNRGEIDGYYAVVKYKDDTVDFEWMDIDEINGIRDRSDAYRRAETGIKAGKTWMTSPWHTDHGEMSKKTVLRRLLKRVPMSADVSMYSDPDDDGNRIAAHAHEGTVIEHPPQRKPTNLEEFEAVPAASEPPPTNEPEPTIIEAEIVDEQPPQPTVAIKNAKGSVAYKEAPAGEVEKIIIGMIRKAAGQGDIDAIVKNNEAAISALAHDAQARIRDASDASPGF